MKDKIIKLRKPKKLVEAHVNTELENGPRMPKESKWAKDAQGERNGPKERRESPK